MYLSRRLTLPSVSLRKGPPLVSKLLSREQVLERVKNGKNLETVVHDVPKEIEDQVAALKLASMSVKIDKLTKEQVVYLSSSGEGT